MSDLLAYDVVALSQKLIQCASVTPDDDGAQDVLIETLVPLGFEAQDYTVNNIRNTVFRLKLGNGEGKHLCFAGHTDVVPVGDEAAWSKVPFGAEIVDGVLYGRGACDMKTGITCFITAVAEYLKDCEENGEVPNGELSFLITGDEEADALYGTKAVLEQLEAEGSLPDYTLVGEPTNPKAAGDEIKVGRRGSLSGALSVTGKQGHVAYPQIADNPLPKLVDLCQALSQHRFDEGNEFFPASNLEITSIDTGNRADNVIPAAAEAKFNIRFNDMWSAETVETKIRALLDETGHGYDLTCKSNAESFLTPQGVWTQIVSDAVQAVTGRVPEMSTKGGTSDARFVAQYGDVVEYGLINTSAHQVDEHMPVSAVHDGVLIYREILKRVFA